MFKRYYSMNNTTVWLELLVVPLGLQPSSLHANRFGKNLNFNFLPTSASRACFSSSSTVTNIGFVKEWTTHSGGVNDGETHGSKANMRMVEK